MKRQAKPITSNANASDYTFHDSGSDEAFFEVVRRRRSVRKYKPQDVPDQDLKTVLDAARLAPSAENSQPWRFIIVKDQGMKDVLAEAAGGQRFIAEAGAIAMVLGARSASCCPNNPARWYVQDPMIAAEHLVLAATALGYGTCWIAMLETRPTPVIEIVKKRLQIPEDVYVIALVTIGVSDEAPEPRPRKKLEEICFKEVYGNAWNT